MFTFAMGSRLFVAWSMFSCLLILPALSFAQQSEVDSLKSALKEMQSQMQKMMDRIEQLEREKQTDQAAVPQTQATAQPAGPSGSAKAVSSAFNPAISVNGLFLGGYSSKPKTTSKFTGLDFQNGFNLQEAEVQFTADVDPYWKANLILAVDRAGKVDVEEGYVTSEELPYDLLPRDMSLKLGKFYAGFGKHNLFHAHQFPFIDKPLISQAAFGDEGLNEPGLSLSYLLPTPWFSEFTAQGMAGENESLFRFNGDSKPRGAYLGHLKNFFDLSDETTMEIGNSYLAGRNGGSGHPLSQAVGLDLTLKWRPLRQATEKGLIWQSEYLYFNKDDKRQSSVNGGGLYSSLQYQFAKQWWLQGRYDLQGIPNFDDGRKHRWTTLLAFVPSEFSAIRLQHSYTTQQRGAPVNQVLLQFNFTIGSHPAHNY